MKPMAYSRFRLLYMLCPRHENAICTNSSEERTVLRKYAYKFRNDATKTLIISNCELTCTPEYCLRSCSLLCLRFCVVWQVITLCLESQIKSASGDASTQPPKPGKDNASKLPQQAKVKHVHKVSFGVTAPKAVIATAPPALPAKEQPASSSLKEEAKKP
uniref:Uncharacterized protein n=1 Tax=Romanomermis culicivorax TaxID=13658 RepID=A0A915K0I8_ROMCU